MQLTLQCTDTGPQAPPPHAPALGGASVGQGGGRWRGGVQVFDFGGRTRARCACRYHRRTSSSRARCSS
eukprot:2956602-Rhodomonas_salina.1